MPSVIGKGLGLRKADPRKLAHSVPFAEFVSVYPDHPLVDVAPSLNYPMDHNNDAGDCVVAGLDHALQITTNLLGVQRKNWTDAEILSYYQTQNPNFRGWFDGGSWRDGGMYIQQFLEYLVSQKVILAFGRIDPTDLEQYKAATYIGLAVVTGETLQEAQQVGKVWDYSPGSPDWGGHCTTGAGYDTGRKRHPHVSWGDMYELTEAFLTKQVDEAWFVLTQAHVDHPEFRNHFDLQGFAKAVSDITEGKVVVPVTPGPTPPPNPGETFLALAPDVAAHIHSVAQKHRPSLTDEKWVDLHFRSYFKGKDV